MWLRIHIISFFDDCNYVQVHELKPSHSHNFRVRAVNSAGVSDWSTTITVMTEYEKVSSMNSTRNKKKTDVTGEKGVCTFHGVTPLPLTPSFSCTVLVLIISVHGLHPSSPLPSRHNSDTTVCVRYWITPLPLPLLCL